MFFWFFCLLFKILLLDLIRGIIGKIFNGLGGFELCYKRDGIMEFDVDFCIFKKRVVWES